MKEKSCCIGIYSNGVGCCLSSFLPKSTVGKKIAMALSGLLLFGFVTAHMLGNLKIFLGVNTSTGRYAFDEYAVHLREIGAEFLGHGVFLWIARLVLLCAVLIHAMSGVSLARLNRIASSTTIRGQKFESANAASRTMAFGGLFIALFIVYHLLHLTLGTLHFSGFVEGHVYANVVLGFRNPLVAIFYIAAMVALGLHLYHGIWSMFQTLGVTNPAWNGRIKSFASAFAVIVAIGFSAIPLSVLLHILVLK